MGSDLYFMSQDIMRMSHPELKALLWEALRHIKAEGWMALENMVPRIEQALANAEIQ